MAVANYYFVRKHFSEKISQVIIDIGSFGIVLMGILMDFVGSTTLDMIWFAGILVFMEVLTLVIAVIFQQFKMARDAIDSASVKPLNF